MKHLFLYLSLLFLSSCSLNKIVIGFASPIVDGGIVALFHETDAEFAKDVELGNLAPPIGGKWIEDNTTFH